jgi:serine/threonine protein kinase
LGVGGGGPGGPGGPPIARFYRPDQAGDTAIYGTTGYAPPEQYGRGQTDARTDIYALGVLLHQMLTGHDPTSTPFALPPPRTLNPAIPPQIAEAIARATSADRAARFADIAEFRAVLRLFGLATVRRSSQAIDRAAPTRQAASSRDGLGRTWTLAGVFTALAAIALAIFLWLRPFAPLDPAAPTPAAAAAGATAEQAETPAIPGDPTPPAEATPSLPPDITPAVNSGTDNPTPPSGKTGSNIVLLRPSGVNASSVVEAGVDASGNAVTYDPQNAIDGRADTTWRVAGDGAGEWLQLDFGSEVSVSSIGLIPGYDKIDPSDRTDRFTQNRVVKVARFEFSDGSSVRASFEQIRDMQFVAFEQPIRTKSIRIVVEQTYPAPPAEQGGRDFTPISEVQVLGSP